MKHQSEVCAPKPEAMINSLRAFGYDLAMALADLIDNSIFAQAKDIVVDYDWNKGKPWVRLLDNGTGMPESELKEAMRLGSTSPLEERKSGDLGRFGLGLKTASFSQCRMLAVRSKIASSETAFRCWDLDHVRKAKEWELLTHIPGLVALLSPLDKMNHGTIVLWQKLDRLSSDGESSSQTAEEHFLDRFRHVAKYLEMVFHRYLVGPDKVTISVGRHICEPWDPFLTKNKFTHKMLDVPEKLGAGDVQVTPYILPHVSKRSTAETQSGSGLYGWNAHQGFYIYRNRRMIIPGGYLDFDFTPEEHFKLCRIMVDLPNHLDHEWSIDVRKASASPPSSIRADLERVAKAARHAAVRIYRARTGTSRNTSSRNTNFSIWLRKRHGDKILYEINRDHEVIRAILDEVKAPKAWERKLFHLIEKTVPHRGIIQDNAEHEDCHVDLPVDESSPPKALLIMCKMMFENALKSGRRTHDAIDYVCAFFDDHVKYRLILEKIAEEKS